MNRYCLSLLLAGMAVVPARAQGLSASEVFRQVSPSIVVIEVRGDSKDRKNSNVIAMGSGVVVPSRGSENTLIATNCHLTDKAPGSVRLFHVRQGEKSEVGFLQGIDSEKDLCLIKVKFIDEARSKVSVKCYGGDSCIDYGEKKYIKLPPVRIASSQWLEIGDPVYAVGAPQGLELTLSDGLVSGIRKSKGTEYIQTTAPISQGSSGGGLFDAQGRLVGITTMYLKDGQNLNFAIPAELIASVPEIKEEDVQPAAQVSEPKPAPPRDRWVSVGGSDSFTAYIDTQTLQRNGTDITVWFKQILNRPKVVDGDKYDEYLALETYHCASWQSTTRIWALRLNGKSLYTKEYKSRELKRKRIMPDTFGEAVIGVVCSEH